MVGQKSSPDHLVGIHVSVCSMLPCFGSNLHFKRVKTDLLSVDHPHIVPGKKQQVTTVHHHIIVQLVWCNQCAGVISRCAMPPRTIQYCAIASVAHGLIEHIPSSILKDYRVKSKKKKSSAVGETVWYVTFVFPVATYPQCKFNVFTVHKEVVITSDIFSTI